MGNIVAIVGRPNVGKSTLFNRLVGRRDAIMDNVSGVTRDRHYGYAEWTGKYFTVIDTGGYVRGSGDVFEAAIRNQVKQALVEAAVVLFVVDVTEGVHHLDKEFADVLRQSEKPIYIVANKADTPNKSYYDAEFYALGLSDKIYSISAMNGSGTGELLDEVITHFSEEGISDPDAGIPRIALLGRPNVGKSSLLNVLLGNERSIVTDVAGTTRDAVDARYKAFGKEFILTDTAGIRKRAKIDEDIEFYSILRSITALERCDICLVLLDATKGLESQDMHIIGLAHEQRKGIVILVNKWDLVEKETGTHLAFEKEIKERLGTIDYVPIVFVSALTKQRIFQAMEKAMEVYDTARRKIPTSELNDVMLAHIERFPPPSMKGKYVKIKYLTQIPAKCPTFLLFCNSPQYVQESYERYLINRMRETWHMEGVPIQLFFRKK
jgi:GTPase